MRRFTFGSMLHIIPEMFLLSAAPSSPFQLFLGEDEFEGRIIALIKTNSKTLHNLLFVYITNKGVAK